MIVLVAMGVKRWLTLTLIMSVLLGRLMHMRCVKLPPKRLAGGFIRSRDVCWGR
jgi:hypothetical protein